MKFVSRGNGEYLVVAESVESGNVNPLGFNFLSLEYPSYLLQTQTNSFSPLLVVRFGGLKTKEKKIDFYPIPTEQNVSFPERNISTGPKGQWQMEYMMQNSLSY